MHNCNKCINFCVRELRWSDAATQVFPENADAMVQYKVHNIGMPVVTTKDYATQCSLLPTPPLFGSDESETDEAEDSYSDTTLSDSSSSDSVYACDEFEYSDDERYESCACKMCLIKQELIPEYSEHSFILTSSAQAVPTFTNGTANLM